MSSKSEQKRMADLAGINELSRERDPSFDFEKANTRTYKAPKMTHSGDRSANDDPDPFDDELDEAINYGPSAGEYMGIKMFVLGGTSYAAPSLKLIGYRGPAELERAIKKELKKRKKKLGEGNRPSRKKYKQGQKVVFNDKAKKHPHWKYYVGLIAYVRDGAPSGGYALKVPKQKNGDQWTVGDIAWIPQSIIDIVEKSMKKEGYNSGMDAYEKGKSDRMKDAPKLPSADLPDTEDEDTPFEEMDREGSDGVRPRREGIMYPHNKIKEVEEPEVSKADKIEEPDSVEKNKGVEKSKGVKDISVEGCDVDEREGMAIKIKKGMKPWTKKPEKYRNESCDGEIDEDSWRKSGKVPVVPNKKKPKSIIMTKKQRDQIQKDRKKKRNEGCDKDRIKDEDKIISPEDAEQELDEGKFTFKPNQAITYQNKPWTVKKSTRDWVELEDKRGFTTIVDFDDIKTFKGNTVMVERDEEIFNEEMTRMNRLLGDEVFGEGIAKGTKKAVNMAKIFTKIGRDKKTLNSLKAISTSSDPAAAAAGFSKEAKRILSSSEYNEFMKQIGIDDLAGQINSMDEMVRMNRFLGETTEGLNESLESEINKLIKGINKVLGKAFGPKGNKKIKEKELAKLYNSLLVDNPSLMNLIRGNFPRDMISKKMKNGKFIDPTDGKPIGPNTRNADFKLYDIISDLKWYNKNHGAGKVEKRKTPK